MKNIKLIIFALFLIAVLSIIYINKQSIKNYIPKFSTTQSTEIKGDSFPLQLIDQSGVSFTLEKPPTRIASITLATDQILSELINQDRLVAVTQYVDYPSLSDLVGFYDKSIPRIQGKIEPILTQQPDLVFIASYTQAETVNYLLRSNIGVIRLNEVKNFNDIMSNISLVAKATDTQIKGQEIINIIETKLADVALQVKGKTKPRVLYYDLNGYSVGGDSLMDESILLSGGINIANGVIAEGENKISEELAISLQPDVIILNKWVFNQGKDSPSPTEILKNKPAWKNVPAILNNRVYAVKGTWLRSVSQARVNGVMVIAKLLHPDIILTSTFNDKNNVQQ